MKVRRIAIYTGLTLVILSIASLVNTGQMIKPGASTQVGYPHSKQGPWLDGNCTTGISQRDWIVGRAHRRMPPWMRHSTPSWLEPHPTGRHIVNMHSENLREIMKQKNIDWVEVEFIGENLCLVVDDRIPKCWLRDKPKLCCGVTKEIAEKLMADSPERFSLGNVD